MNWEEEEQEEEIHEETIPFTQEIRTDHRSFPVCVSVCVCEVGMIFGRLYSERPGQPLTQ
jgi:hypothetical protein